MRIKALAPRVPTVLYELAFAVVTLSTAAPLVAARHLPLQDLPQHMAAIAVLRRLPFDHGLGAYFALTLSRTQYLLVYALGLVLSLPLGVENAARAVAAITVCALPYALRFALARTGGDRRLAALAWPLVWNPQMLLGFLNFLLGFPIALTVLGLFANERARRKPGRQVLLAVLSLAAFYSHLVPYGLLGLGVLLLLPWTAIAAPDPAATLTNRLRAMRTFLGSAIRDLVFLVPSLVAVFVWLVRTPASDASVRAGGVGVVPHPEWPALASLPRDLSNTLLDIPGDRDERALILWGLCLLAALALARRGVSPSATPTPVSLSRVGIALAVPLLTVLGFFFSHTLHVALSGLWSTDFMAEESWGRMLWHAALVGSVATFVGLTAVNTEVSPPHPSPEGARLAWLPVLCAVLYVCTPASYGWILPLNTRFSVAAALTLPFLMGVIRPVGATVLLSAVLSVASIGLSSDVADRFARWQSAELGDLDAALSHCRPGRRLIALVPAQSSGIVPNVPLLHSAAYYQVRGGDIATFSFADFPQSPFRYREDGPRPPRLPPRWEWTSDLTVADPDGTYYDYVLARAGGFDTGLRASGRYTEIYQGSEWTVWERRPR